MDGELDPLTCPYCDRAPSDDDTELIDQLEELGVPSEPLTAPALHVCEHCGEVAVLMPPAGPLIRANDIERAAYRRAERTRLGWRR